MQSDDTIFALSSGHGRAGVAVVRVSGPEVRAVITDIAGLSKVGPRQTRYLAFRNPREGTLIDRGLLIFFPGPASFTGEDVAEFHDHGSLAVLDELFECFTWNNRVRPAEPGEFTRRAFHNGKMDLTEVEGLADLIEAETRIQKNQALAQTGGSLGRLYDAWRADLVRASALIEADIDFADEELPDDLWDQAGPLITRVAEGIRAHLADSHRGERLRSGYRIVVLGAPNAGKSSLVNQLARRDAAIVSDEPGTTRDVVEVHLDLGGYPVIVTDTAGLRETEGAVEQEGIRRAKAIAAGADLRIWLRDARVGPESDPKPEEIGPDDLTVWNHIDEVSRETLGQPGQTDCPMISAKNGEGIGNLLDLLTGKVRSALAEGQTDGLPSLTRARYRRELEATLAGLDAMLHRAETATLLDTDLMAEDLRLGVRALGRITGRVDVEELLDTIFGTFCLGK